MQCVKCCREIPDGSQFCNHCGRKQASEKRSRSRANGEGTVYKKKNGRYRAVVTLGYYVDENGKRHRMTRSATFDKKKDAVEALVSLRQQPEHHSMTFKQLYEKFYEAHKENTSRSTMNCYSAAYKHFRPLWFMSMDDIDIDDLQECVDNCGHGRRTRENMKALAGLMYKYGIPRHVIPENLNLAQFIRVTGEGAAERESFDDIQIEKIRKAMNETPYADYVYCMIYLGFRPSEFLALNIMEYDRENRVLRGGAKTDAGINRYVTIPIRIQPIIGDIIGDRTDGTIFYNRETGTAWTLKDFTEKVFYPVLDAAGIENPLVEIAGGTKRHRYTPHTCRHTYATLLKRVEAPTKDKQRLIGHSSDEMLRYYQDVSLSDLRQITDQL